MIKLFLILLSVSTIMFSCAYSESQNLEGRLKKIKINASSIVKTKKADEFKYNVISSVDNSCSICVASIVELISNFYRYESDNFQKTKFYYIVKSKDTANIQSYLKRFSINISDNISFVIDDKDEYVKSNSTLVDGVKSKVILTDSLYNIIVLLALLQEGHMIVSKY